MYIVLGRTVKTNGAFEYHTKGGRVHSSFEEALGAATERMIADPNIAELFIGEVVERVYRQAPPITNETLKK